MTSETRGRFRVRLNGDWRQVDPETDLGQLVTAWVPDDDHDGVAVAVNGEVVPRSKWQERRVRDGDEIEIVRAVQGG